MWRQELLCRHIWKYFVAVFFLFSFFSLWLIFTINSIVNTKLIINLTFYCTHCSKSLYLPKIWNLRNWACRHILTACRHMWRMATRLDTAGLNHFSLKNLRFKKRNMSHRCGAGGQPIKWFCDKLLLKIMMMKKVCQNLDFFYDPNV